MNSVACKKLIRYLKPKDIYLPLGIFLLFFALVSISTIIIPILSTGCAILLFWMWSSARKQFKADLAVAEKQGELNQIASDFSASQDILKKKIRIGECCVYAKQCGRIVRYRDIRRYYVRTSYDVRTKKSYLYPLCEMTNGEHVSLCQLRASRSLDQHTALIRLGNSIRKHNPGVRIDL